MIDKGLARARLSVILDTLDMPLESKGYQRVHIQELMNFVEGQEMTIKKQADYIVENGVTLTSKQFLIDLLREETIKAKKMIEGQDELITQLNEDSDEQDKLISRYEDAMERIDAEITKAVTNEVKGNDSAVPTAEAVGFRGPWGISADGGGCQCNACIGLSPSDRRYIVDPTNANPSGLKRRSTDWW